MFPRVPGNEQALHAGGRDCKAVTQEGLAAQCHARAVVLTAAAAFLCAATADVPLAALVLLHVTLQGLVSEVAGWASRCEFETAQSAMHSENTVVVQTHHAHGQQHTIATRHGQHAPLQQTWHMSVCHSRPARQLVSFWFKFASQTQLSSTARQRLGLLGCGH